MNWRECKLSSKLQLIGLVDICLNTDFRVQIAADRRRAP